MAGNLKYHEFGGFPGPINLLRRAVRHTAPDTYRKVERKMTTPITTKLEPSSVPWLNFSGLVVGRNSYFHTDPLTTKQLEDIGGTEYRALQLLSYLVPAVSIRLFSIIRLMTLIVRFISILFLFSSLRFYYLCHGSPPLVDITASSTLNIVWLQNLGAFTLILFNFWADGCAFLGSLYSRSWPHIPELV